MTPADQRLCAVAVAFVPGAAARLLRLLRDADDAVAECERLATAPRRARLSALSSAAELQRPPQRVVAATASAERFAVRRTIGDVAERLGGSSSHPASPTHPLVRRLALERLVSASSA